MPLYMGIDAGGTKTDCAVSNGALLIGEAVGKSCKVAQVGEQQARISLRDVILRTCEVASVSPQDIGQVCIGISGASVPGNAAWVQTVIQQVVAGRVRVMGDHVVAHRAAFDGRPGVLVIAGTGSIAYGSNEQGENARAGGWGAMISDEGSAFWIGREAVATALRDHDLHSHDLHSDDLHSDDLHSDDLHSHDLHNYDMGNQHGIFATIAQRWKASTPDEVVRIANSGLLARFSELALPVAEAAEHGNPTAESIMLKAGRELAALAEIVIARLWPKGGPVRVALSGGVLHGSRHVRQSFHLALQAVHPDAAVSFDEVRPVLGALSIAVAGESPTPEAAP